MKVTTIKADQNGPRPSYPFVETKIISPGRAIGQTAEFMRNGRRVYEQDFAMTLSLNTYSDKQEVAEDLVYSAFSYLQINGHYDLSLQNITVQKLNVIENRTTVLTIGYEYHYGFDIVVNVRSQVIMEPELIDAVDFEMSGKHEGKE